MDYTILTTLGGWVASVFGIMILMTIGHLLMSLVYPKDCAEVMRSEDLSFEEKKQYMEQHAPKSGMFFLILNNIASAFVGCCLYALYAPVEPETLWVYQVMTLILFMVMQYIQLKMIPHPDWYESYACYFVWMLSIIYLSDHQL